MESIATATFTSGVIAYSVAATLFFLSLTRPSAGSRGEIAARTLGVAATLHLAHIVAASLFSHICPVETLHFALSLSALVSVVVFLAFRSKRRLDALGVFVAPLALTFLVASQFIDPSSADPAISRTMLALHVSANLTGFGLVLVAGAAAAFYVFTERQLKRKRMAAMGRLPSLEALDLLEHRLLLLGFPLLTFGVVSGAMFFSAIGAASGASLVRALLGYLTWFLVLGVLLLRALLGWRGRRTAYGTLLGVGSVTLVVLVYLARPFFGGLF